LINNNNMTDLMLICSEARGHSGDHGVAVEGAGDDRTDAGGHVETQWILASQPGTPLQPPTHTFFKNKF
jgi:hypothetical protein